MPRTPELNSLALWKGKRSECPSFLPEGSKFLTGYIITATGDKYFLKCLPVQPYPDGNMPTHDYSAKIQVKTNDGYVTVAVMKVYKNRSPRDDEQTHFAYINVHKDFTDNEELAREFSLTASISRSASSNLDNKPLLIGKLSPNNKALQELGFGIEASENDDDESDFDDDDDY